MSSFRVPLGSGLYRVAFFVEELVDELLVHCFVERNLDWCIRLHAQWCTRVRQDVDVVARKTYRLVVLGEDLE